MCISGCSYSVNKGCNILSQDQSQFPLCCFPTAGKVKRVSPRAKLQFVREENKHFFGSWRGLETEQEWQPKCFFYCGFINVTCGADRLLLIGNRCAPPFNFMQQEDQRAFDQSKAVFKRLNASSYRYSRLCLLGKNVWILFEKVWLL